MRLLMGLDVKIDDNLILKYSRDLNVLYVQDIESHKDGVIRELSKFFCNVDSVKNAEEGYERYTSCITQAETSYDIVFIDLTVFGTNGLNLAKKLKKINAELALIFLMPFDDMPLLHQALEEGADGFLFRPIKLEKLKIVLYKIAKDLSDSKYIEQHCAQLENNYLFIPSKIDSGKFNTGKDICEDLIAHKNSISIMWTMNEDVKQRLEKYSIDAEYFRKHFGLRVISYFLDIIYEKLRLGIVQ